MRKYGNVKTTVDSITFDSKLEAKFYEFIKGAKADGKIKDFEIQKRFEVFPAFKKNGVNHRKIEYVADFIVHHHDGMVEVIDTKGVETDVFKIKRKLFEHRYPDLELKAITYSRKDGGWVELSKVKARRKEDKKKRLG